MILDLSERQWLHVRNGSSPLRLVDPQTGVCYILLPEEHVKRLQQLYADGPLSNEERETILRGVWKRAGWDDPAMDDYESLDPRKKA